MRVTRHYAHKHILHDYTLHQQTVENIHSGKYLAITITENMDWGQHISDISFKSTKTSGLFRSNLAFAPRSTKEMHTKLWYALNWNIQHLLGAHIVKLRYNKWRKYRGPQLAGPLGVVVLVRCWPTQEAWRDQSSLFFFHKIYCGTMPIVQDKHFNLSQST